MFYVKDLERMKRFYKAMIGVEPASQDGSNVWTVFDAGGTRFALHAIPREIAENIAITSAPWESEPVKLIFEVSDLESAGTT